jgi:excinuclease ABC subunit C
MSMNDRIRDKLALLPERPGVYIMRNADGEIIYIGKALVLKNRVRSYFTGTHTDAKTVQLVSQIADFEYVITNSEREALVLEANLIRENQPKYNIMLKDDKSFPFIKVTLSEDYPRAIVTRELKKDGGKYFGPYTDARTLRRTIRHLEWIFPLRTCKLKIVEGKSSRERPCINFQLHKCPAPCTMQISKEEYHSIVKQAIRFLNGHDKELIDSLEAEMLEFSEHLEFEKAARIRDRLAGFRKLSSTRQMFFTDGLDRDVLGIYHEGGRTAVAVLKILSGKLLNRELYRLDHTESSESPEILEAFLKQYYTERIESLPNLILIPFEIPDFPSMYEYLDRRLMIPQRGENRSLLVMARENAFNAIEEAKLNHLRKSDRTVHPIRELKDKLGLTRLPRKIICIDISTIQGTDTVSSLVFFENGKPRKKNYMHFIMKTVTGQDDFASMAETLTRYLDKIDQYEKPDLIVIDGGKGQLHSAHDILASRNIPDVEMISLAKRVEEVFLPGRSDSILLPRASAALRILVCIRDEAHRFAVEFHRHRRKSRTLTSELDQVKGIGKEKRFLLLKQFGSVERLKSATIEELTAVPGIGEKMARKVIDGLLSIANEASEAASEEVTADSSAKS